MSAAAQPDLSKLPDVLPANLPDVLSADGTPAATRSQTPPPPTMTWGMSNEDAAKAGVPGYGQNAGFLERLVMGQNAPPRPKGQSFLSYMWDTQMKRIHGSPETKPALIAAGTLATGNPESGIIADSLLQAAGAGLGTEAGRAATGQSVADIDAAKDVATNAALAGGSNLALRGASAALGSKLARGTINESLGASARDVTYGNPARALEDEGINSWITGDLEKYKDTLRATGDAGAAENAAGGRFAAVSQRVRDLAPQLDAALKASKAQIPVANVIDKPLDDAASKIITNRAMTQAEKDTAISQLGALQQSLKEGLSNTITPLQANQIKQAIGSRVNWAGNIAVTDEVKPAYRAVYGSLKNAVNSAVPDAAPLNERLENLLAAKTDLEKLMKAEEVGQGKAALGSAVTGVARRAEAAVGRVVPSARSATTGSSRWVPAGVAALRAMLGSGPMIP